MIDRDHLGVIQFLVAVAEDDGHVRRAASVRGKGVEVLGNEHLPGPVLTDVNFQLEDEILQNAIVLVRRPGHLDQLPFVEFVALVFLEGVVVELLGCQQSLRRAHGFSLYPRELSIGITLSPLLSSTLKWWNRSPWTGRPSRTITPSAS
jgi:hypothetical protein